jgi:hypothetical protein
MSRSAPSLTKLQFTRSTTRKQRMGKVSRGGKQNRGSVFQNNAPIKLVSVPVSNGSIRRSAKPKQVRDKGGVLTVDHCEYIAEVSKSIVFTSTTFPLNPGQYQTFPWLSTIAQQFEKYEFSRLQFEYSTESPSIAGGIIILGTDWDASDPPAVGKQELYSFPDTVSSPVWENCVYTASPAELRALGKRFVRPGANPPNTDIKLYDIGNFQIASQGAGGNAVSGELRVSYTVRLYEPQLNSIGSVALSGEFISNTNAAAPILQPGSVAQITNIATTTGVGYTNNFAATAPGQYLITVQVAGTTLAVPTVTTSGTLYDSFALVNAALTSASIIINVYLLANQTVIIGTGNATITDWRMRIAPYQGN